MLKQSQIMCLGCGKEFTMFDCHIKRGDGKYCSKDCKNGNAPYDDLTGQTFGRLTVIDKHSIRYRHHILWNCSCSCGNSITVRSDALKSEKTKSCGCYTHDNTWRIIHDRVFAVEKSLYLQGIKQKSKKRGWDNWISIEEYRHLIHQPCAYCGDINSNRYQDPIRVEGEIGSVVVQYNGIDRVDNTKGYVTGNVVPACKHCNRAKNNMTYGEWMEWVKRLSDNFVYSKFSSRAGIRV